MNIKTKSINNPLGDYPSLNDKVSAKMKKRARKPLKTNIMTKNGVNKIETPLEIEEQKTLVEYCYRMGYLSFAVPNAGKRGKTAQRNAKKEGILEGASDYIILLSNKILFIEMKRRPQKLKSGKLSVAHTTTSDAQKAFIARANEYPYAEALVAYGADMAIRFIKSNI